MQKYDVVVGAGCSFMNGDQILDKDGKAFNPNIDERPMPGKYLSELLNTNHKNISHTGSSNERIIREVYNWVETNHKYKNPLIIIGLSGLARYSFQNQITKKFFDLQPAQVSSYDEKALSSVNNKLTNNVGKTKELRTWLEYYMKYLFNVDFQSKKLQREVVMLHYYLKAKGCDYRIHNSLEDNLGDIKDKINYISFQDDKYTEQDAWKPYMMWQMKNIDGEEYDDVRNRSPITPYGKRFCKGHPSPNACKQLAERIYEDLDL